jgi:hypothetical protein
VSSRPEAALALVATLAVVVVLAVLRSNDRSADLPRPVGSYPALAGPAAFGRRTDCGQTVGPRTEGVALAVLPCGARIYLAYRGTQVLTRVIGHRRRAKGRDLDLTDALARKLRIAGVREIRWSYAQAR